jgi:hypothetical protein
MCDWLLGWRQLQVLFNGCNKDILSGNQADLVKNFVDKFKKDNV